MKPYTLLFAAVLALPALQAAAADNSQQNLTAIKQRIDELQRELNRVKDARGQLLKALQGSEKQIAELHQRIDRINRGIDNRDKKLNKLKQQQQQLEESRRNMQRQVEREVTAAYRLGRQEQLKLLLNQQDPQQIARQLRYHAYFLEARRRIIGDYLGTLEDLAAVGSDIEHERDALTAEQDQLQLRQQQLSGAQQDRRRTLDQLTGQLASKRDELKQLQADRQRLQKLVDEVRRAAASLAANPGQTPFANRRGRMVWPADGRRGNAYGQRRANGLTWMGVTIRADAGMPVKAIHPGRVVFADYLRGQGMLLILDHGDGYMSLYGRNQSLARTLGEWVAEDEIIARVGSSGGGSESALYFEIRHRGKPQDPANWCRS